MCLVCLLRHGGTTNTISRIQIQILLYLFKLSLSGPRPQEKKKRKRSKKDQEPTPSVEDNLEAFMDKLSMRQLVGNLDRTVQSSTTTNTEKANDERDWIQIFAEDIVDKSYVSGPLFIWNRYPLFCSFLIDSSPHYLTSANSCTLKCSQVPLSQMTKTTTFCLSLTQSPNQTFFPLPRPLKTLQICSNMTYHALALCLVHLLSP